MINYSTWGSTEQPSDFKFISPNALVTARDPPTLLLNITPPSFLTLSYSEGTKPLWSNDILLATPSSFKIPLVSPKFAITHTLLFVGSVVFFYFIKATHIQVPESSNLSIYCFIISSSVSLNTVANKSLIFWSSDPV